jgi:hypothetical protein
MHNNAWFLSDGLPIDALALYDAYWLEVPDYPMHIAQQLGPETVHSRWDYHNGARAVIHRVGKHWYRIYTTRDGSVYYQMDRFIAQ